MFRWENDGPLPMGCCQTNKSVSEAPNQTPSCELFRVQAFQPRPLEIYYSSSLPPLSQRPAIGHLVLIAKHAGRQAGEYCKLVRGAGGQAGEPRQSGRAGQAVGFQNKSYPRRFSDRVCLFVEVLLVWVNNHFW